MNVLFHLTAGVAIVSGLIKNKPSGIKYTWLRPSMGFVLGVLSHGVLDCIPHCYPIHSKIDVGLSLGIILAAMYRVVSKYKWLMSATMFGCIFPDIFDLGPKILHKNLGIKLWEMNNVFPWHQAHYSGSIYQGSCTLSTMYHFLVILVCGLVIFTRRKSIKNMFINK